MTTLHRISYIGHAGALAHEWRPTFFTANDRVNELVTLGHDSVDFEEVEVPWDHQSDLIHFLNTTHNHPPTKERAMCDPVHPTIGKLQNMTAGSITGVEQAYRMQTHRITLKRMGWSADSMSDEEVEGRIAKHQADVLAAKPIVRQPEVAAPAKPSLESQVGGDRYKKLGDYQPWEVLRRWLTPEEFRGYMKGQAITYLARERDKGGDEDVAKAEHYLQGLLELQSKE